jgi:hypothetical protein
MPLHHQKLDPLIICAGWSDHWRSLSAVAAPDDVLSIGADVCSGEPAKSQHAPSSSASGCSDDSADGTLIIEMLGIETINLRRHFDLFGSKNGLGSDVVEVIGILAHLIMFMVLMR